MQFKHLKHLEHLEDLTHKFGAEGKDATIHAAQTALSAVRSGNPGAANITTKWDGSPGITFGTHPSSGKFFVATKSAFNKEPKLNTSHVEIEHNYGDRPELANKLHAALTHLPKITPKGGIYAGDLMHTHEDVHEEGSKVTFKPNTIKYAVDKTSSEGGKAAGSKLGIAIHTQYKGTGDLASRSASFNPDMSKFKSHPDVHVVQHKVKSGPLETDKSAEDSPENHLKSATEHLNKLSSSDVEHLHGQNEHLSTYINSTIKTGQPASHEGYMQHLSTRYAAGAAKLKTDNGRARQNQAAVEHIGNVSDHADAYHNYFAAQSHLRSMKNALVSHLDKSSDYEHTINGEHTGSEGYVMQHKGYPIKLVNRQDFSAKNLLSRPR